MTAKELARAEREYQQNYEKSEKARKARNDAILTALAEGWSHAKIAEATGLTRARIGQIALTRNA